LIWTLVPVAAIYGLAAALAFRRWSDEASLRRTVNRMMAHVMEFRLFLDSPVLVLRAQRDLLRDNLQLLRMVALPGAILAAVFLVLYPQLDAIYGHAPLRTGERSVVTVQLGDLPEPPSLEAPAGIAVETPGVRVVHDRQVSWRVRPLGRTSGELKLRYDGRVLTKQIVAGGGLIYGLRIPFISPAIDIRYPRASILGVNWMVWFFLISSGVAIAWRRGYIAYRLR
jgi:hypothetical protein